jgi:hypothetical protein
MHHQDVTNCIEQLTTIEKEVRSLQDAQKYLGDAKDHLEARSIEKSELQLRRNVRVEINGATRATDSLHLTEGPEAARKCP